MRQILNLVLITLCLGCAIDFSRIAPGYTEAFKSINNLLFGYEDNIISAELIENIPYASMIITIGKGPQGLMILESKNYQDNIWVSADKVYLKERNGRIIQTRGLNNNIDELIYTVDFSDLRNIDTTKTYIYFKSFSNPTLNNLVLEAKFSIKETKLVRLVNQNLYLTLVEEKVSSKVLGWNFVNEYWIDENSYVWKSSQKISPKLPRVFIEVTKKPS